MVSVDGGSRFLEPPGRDRVGFLKEISLLFLCGGGCSSPAEMEKCIIRDKEWQGQKAGFACYPGKGGSSQLNKSPSQKVLRHDQ